jgi:peptide/nickel transport system substrate-binding protein
MIGGALTYATGSKEAVSQSRGETLRALGSGAPNTLDPQSTSGIDRPAQGAIECITDRLVTFGTKTGSNGVDHYDYYNVMPALAESWQYSSGGTSLTFKIRSDATFHDNSPVTAEDVKWCLDRMVSQPSTRGQMKAGSLEKPEQFVVLGAHTLRMDFSRKDNRTLPDLCHPYASIVNAKLAKKHITEKDPWASEWLKNNPAGGGAYKIASWKPGEEVIYVRNDNWKCGPKSAFQRVIYQVVPEAANRRALIERGNADITLDLPPKDVNDLEKASKLQILSVPAINGFEFVAMTTTTKPYDNVKIRQAVASALPYAEMFKAAIFDRGKPLYGGPEGKPTSINWPTAFPYRTDLNRARKLLAEADCPNGFETTFVFDQAQADVGEPASILIQEALGKIGIKVTIEKQPSGEMGSALQSHKIPFYYQRSAAWLNDPVYAFEIFYQGDWRWNLGNLKDAELDKTIEAARFETDNTKYDAMCIRMKEIAFEQVPTIMLWQPFVDVIAQKDIAGYRYMPHRQIDFRTLRRV